MKIWYFENTHRDESNDILYDIIYRCILVEKHSQSKLGLNCTFSTRSSIGDGGNIKHGPIWWFSLNLNM